MDGSELLPHPLVGGAFPSPVPPGTGWPDDPADSSTPVAATPAQAASLAGAAVDLDTLDARISVCRACPRLVSWREEAAVTKRKSFADQPYWGRPVPGFGDEAPEILVVGLAPAANGSNRTSRMFTGDRAGDWLYAALYRAGFAAIPTSTHVGDGQRLRRVRIMSAVRCAPPGNKPATAERDACAPWMAAELAFVLPTVRVIVALGGYGWDAALRSLRDAGVRIPRPKPRFGHGARAEVETSDGRRIIVLGCFHPSQQNTFTGRLTERMLDELFADAKALCATRGVARGE
ncbi:uracil-DNA glycosylase [Tomitella fengzijianii]|uniref:Type-5 uracil-DNA glycosylase n=1 Tax=Tomitella fengzijianii TaxID=2597660 RepID=A0A516X3P6_9ACTN|nr:uracil-DNA glycosylase [Tomitella fengzijianii]QDQ97271.1 uracil-DNA glycosylase [Tomitella fengzijianii]